jgi:peroxiredoxin Q/BCP
MMRSVALCGSLILGGLCAGRLLADEPRVDSPAAASATVELTVGEAVPGFEAVGDDGQPWRAADHVGKKIVVMYFYPGDFTGGCIKQAQAFREGLARLEALDVELIGVSGDSVATHQLFKTTYGLKHTLLADPEGALAKQLGLPVQKGAKVRTRGPDGQPLLDGAGKSIMVERGAALPRWTLVIGKDGKLLSKRTQVNPATDADEVARLVADAAR